MKKKLQKLLAIVCVAVSVLGLIGCAKPFDATAYVQAELDLLTKHDVAQYQKTLGVRSGGNLSGKYFWCEQRY